MRRIALRARMPLKGTVDEPLFASQSSPGPGFFANTGSAAIQIMKGNKGSLASALALTSGDRTGPGEMRLGGSVSTVKEPEVSWRAAVATARRMEGSGSEAAWT